MLTKAENVQMSKSRTIQQECTNEEKETNTTSPRHFADRQLQEQGKAIRIHLVSKGLLQARLGGLV